MKKSLIVSLCSVTLALTAFAQDPAASPAAPADAAAVSPATDLGAPPAGAAMTPADGTAPTVAPGAPTDPAASPAVPAAGAPAVATSPAAPAPAAASPAAAGPTAAQPPATEEKVSKNFLIDNFRAGGPIMWPILIVSIIALMVVIERCFWWGARFFRRDPKRVEKVFTAIETGDVDEASKLARGSRDPVLRMLWNGLNHQHASLQGALQVAAGIEIKRAGRFLVVMDTLVTLAPLLGLLGTITGLMKSFGSLGNEELAVQAVTGGISEALIATACGLGIAIFSLIPFNFFTSRVSNLEFELQTAATNLEVMLEANSKAKREAEMTSTSPRA
ncbi:MAG: MotA/TolQ/ExbB proton channel family protein [Chthoniobacterales bacterium]